MQTNIFMAPLSNRILPPTGNAKVLTDYFTFVMQVTISKLAMTAPYVATLLILFANNPLKQNRLSKLSGNEPLKATPHVTCFTFLSHSMFPNIKVHPSIGR